MLSTQRHDVGKLTLKIALPSLIKDRNKRTLVLKLVLLATRRVKNHSLKMKYSLIIPSNKIISTLQEKMSIKNTIVEFCDSTSLHGLGFITNKKLSLVVKEKCHSF